MMPFNWDKNTTKTNSLSTQQDFFLAIWYQCCYDLHEQTFFRYGLQWQTSEENLWCAKLRSNIMRHDEFIQNAWSWLEGERKEIFTPSKCDQRTQWQYNKHWFYPQTQVNLWCDQLTSEIHQNISKYNQCNQTIWPALTSTVINAQFKDKAKQYGTYIANIFEIWTPIVSGLPAISTSIATATAKLSWRSVCCTTSQWNATTSSDS